MGIKTVPHPPYSSDVTPCDFSLSPKLRGCRYETIEEMKEVVTKLIDTLPQDGFSWGLPEVVGTVQVHCNRRRLLRRGLEINVCTINKSAHTKKVWKLIKWSSNINFLWTIVQLERFILNPIYFFNSNWFLSKWSIMWFHRYWWKSYDGNKEFFIG